MSSERVISGVRKLSVGKMKSSSQKMWPRYASPCQPRAGTPTSRPMVFGETVYLDETVTTGPNSSTALLFLDETRLQIARLVAESPRSTKELAELRKSEPIHWVDVPGGG